MADENTEPENNDYDKLDQIIKNRTNDKGLRKNEKVVSIAQDLSNKNMYFRGPYSESPDLSKKKWESKEDTNRRVLLVLLLVGGILLFFILFG